MLETPHALVGGAIGAATGNPAAAAVTATASHFAGDTLPHWNPTFPFHSLWEYAFVIADFILAEAIVVALYFLFPDRPEIAIGAFFGTVPDILITIHLLFRPRWLKAYGWIHHRFHHEVPLAYGLWPQSLIAVGSLAYLISLLI
jgi:hypothetical protein